MIEVKNVYKEFSGHIVLNNICAEFEPGKTNLTIGQSGSGKTVLLKCIAGLHSVSYGDILYDNRSFSAMNEAQRKEIRKEMGMVFQGGALFDSNTVEENVMFPLEMFTDMTYDERRERANECLKRVNIINANDKYPSEISGGMQKRVAIARAIALNPKYLYCDEPNSGLDPVTSIVIDNLIHDITIEYNITTIVNTHDMNSVMEIGDNIIFIYKGYKYWQGTSREIFNSGVEELDNFVFASARMKEIRGLNNSYRAPEPEIIKPKVEDQPKVESKPVSYFFDNSKKEESKHNDQPVSSKEEKVAAESNFVVRVDDEIPDEPIRVIEPEEQDEPIRVTEPEEQDEPIRVMELEEQDEPISVTEPEEQDEPIRVMELEEQDEPISVTEPEEQDEPIRVIEPEEQDEPIRVTEPEEQDEPIRVTEPEEQDEPIRVIESEEQDELDEKSEEVMAIEESSAQEAYDRKKIIELVAQMNENYRLENWQGLLETCNKILVIDPRNELAYMRRSTANGNLSRFEDSIDDSKMVIELNAANADAYYNCGIAHLMMKRFVTAIDYFKSSVEKGIPNVGDVYMTIANIYNKLSDDVNYREYLQKSAGYDNPDAKFLLDNLKQVSDFNSLS